MTRWLRVVVPPSWVLLILFVGWVPFGGLSAAWWSLLGQPPDREVRLMAVLSLGFCMGVYGVYRAVRAHPAFPLRADYAAWLARTPWTPAKPLPDGPVLLVAQDAFVLAVVAGPAWAVSGREAWPILPAFLLAYLSALGWLVHRTGEKAAAYLAWFGVGGMLLLGHVPAVVLALAAVSYAAAAVGFRRSLWRFPWLPDVAAKARQRVSEAQTLGWPFDRLVPLPAPPLLLPTWDGIARGLLTGWVLFAVGFQLDRGEPNTHGEPPSMIVQLVFFIVLIAAISRLGAYVKDCLPPISLPGRLATGRLVIPRYDVIFVAPVLAVAAAAVGPVCAAALGQPAYLGSAIGSGVAFAVLLTMGPERARWQLTAPARLVPAGKPPTRQPAPVAASIAGR